MSPTHFKTFRTDKEAPNGEIGGVMLIIPASLNPKTRNDLNYLNKELSESLWIECSLNTEAKRCFATNDEDIDYFKMCIYIILIACVYIQQFNFFNNVPMAQWSTLMPCNREAAGSNLSGVLAFF